MTGGGRGWCNPYSFNMAAGPYGRAGWMPYSGAFYSIGAVDPQIARDQEIDFLKNQTDDLRRQIAEIEKRMKEFRKK
jgi:hypothetical protein